MLLNLSYDASTSAAPAGFFSAMSYVANFFNATFVDPVTVNISVGWGEVKGTPLDSGALGESIIQTAQTYTYAQVRNALIADASSPTDGAASGSLGAANPTGSGSFRIGSADAKAIGLLAGNNTATDGWVGFAANPALFTFDPSNRATGGKYDFIGNAEHEITEVMGRFAVLGTLGGAYSTLDLFRYGGPGARQLVGGRSAYASVNSGVGGLGSFNTVSGGDYGDWATSVGADSFDAVIPSGVLEPFSYNDRLVMDAIGWNVVPASNRPVFDPSWSVVATRDFNGDGQTDLAYRRPSDGLVEIQLISGTNSLGGGAIAGSPFDASWTLAGSGDFNGDGKADLVYRRNSDRLTEIQLLSGATGIGGGVIGNNPFGADWNVVGTGDFSGDGSADLVWRRASDGLLEIQFLNGGVAVGGGVIANNSFDTSWNVVGLGEFNGDGRQDIVWRRASDGLVEIQNLDHADNVIGGGVITNNPFNLGWTVVGVGDFNGDAQTDLVWQRSTDGLVEIQLIKNDAAIGGGVIANNVFDPSWTVAGIGDFNGDGMADLAWRRPSDGMVEVQLVVNDVAVDGGIVAGKALADAGAIESGATAVVAGNLALLNNYGAVFANGGGAGPAIGMTADSSPGPSALDAIAAGHGGGSGAG